VALDLAYVSAGRFEGFWEMGPHYWDVAAGMLLVTEAGGCVSTLTADKKPITPETDTIIAGNSHLYQPLLDKLMEV
jgi:myo-inositol-1(or 4)-monophosphatase